MDEQNKVLPKEQVVSALEAVVDESIQELENDLIPGLKHGEAKRLLIAVLKYPKEDTDFSQEPNVNLIRAFSVSKRLQDALVGLSTEVVIERMISEQMAAEAQPEEGGEIV